MSRDIRSLSRLCHGELRFIFGSEDIDTNSEHWTNADAQTPALFGAGVFVIWCDRPDLAIVSQLMGLKFGLRDFH